MTKRKLYWILFIPSILILILTFNLLPEGKKNYSIFVVVIFWIAYYSILKITNLKTKNKSE